MIKYIIIFVLFYGCIKPCEGQPLVTIPRCIIFPASNSIQFYDGTTVGTRQLVGFTISSTQITAPTVVDGSVTNEGQISFTGNTSQNGITLNSNTTGSTAIKIHGEGGCIYS